MRLNSNLDYIRLMQRSLKRQIAPELASADGKSAAQIMLAILAELEKREGPGARLLEDTIAEGRIIADEMAQLADSPAELPSPPAPGAPFEELRTHHAALTGEMARLADATSSMAECADLLMKAAQWEASFYQRNAQLENGVDRHSANEPNELTAEQVERLLNQSGSMGGEVRVSDFRALPGGFGKQTYRVLTIDPAGKERDLIIRKMDPKPIMSHGGCALESEFSLLKTLEQTGFPAPRPFLLCQPSGDLGESLYFTERLAGSAAGTYLCGIEGAISEQFYVDLATWLGRLHAYPVDMFADHIARFVHPGLEKMTASDAYRHALTGWGEYIQGNPHLDSPVIEWIMDWLTRNIPESDAPPVLVHGDYNVHNVLQENGRLTAVLDWECSEFGFPEQDLAWMKANIERQFDWQRFLEIYRSAGGASALDEQTMRFCSVYAALRTNLAGNRATQNLQSGANPDIRYAMVELGFTGSFMSTALKGASHAQCEQERVRQGLAHPSVRGASGIRSKS